MRVLLLGVTGNVGSKLFPALLAHGHEVAVYVRNPSKLSPEVTSRAKAVVTGSGTDSDKIKAAILSNQCDALVNAAGIANPWKRTTEFPAIFAAVAKGAADASRERSSDQPLRCWFLSGWALLDSPRKEHPIMDFIPLYPDHVANFNLIRSVETTELAWSLFCASTMSPRSETVSYPATTGNNLLASADVPPAYSKTLLWLPIIGIYLNIMMQAQSYFAYLEDCADFIAQDLTKGAESEFVGHRVGVKNQSAAK